MIDIKSGEIIEFVDEEIENLQKKVAEKYGYKLVDHKLELYGVKKNNMDLEIIKPFGPSIVKLKLPKEIIEQMNKYTDEVIKDKKKSESLNHGSKLVRQCSSGNSSRFRIYEKIKWAEFLAKACEKWLQRENNKQLKNFKLIESWIVRQFKHDYNPIHFHSGHISGVGYLKVPKNMGLTFKKIKKIIKTVN